MTYSRSRKRHNRVRNRLIAVSIVSMLLGFMVGHGSCSASTAAPVPAQADALEVEPPPFVIQIQSETEPETNAPNTLEALEPKRETFNLYEHIAMEMTSEEFRLLGLILAMEAQTEPFDGQKAVVEVIFNRVLSPDFPDTVYDVLSQKGQFSTWKYRNNPYNIPGDSELAAIDEVITNGNQNTVLPEGYVFFSRDKVNGTDFIKIGNHQFSKAKVRK